MVHCSFFRQLIDLQNQDIADLEQALKETQSTQDQDQVKVEPRPKQDVETRPREECLN